MNRVAITTAADGYQRVAALARASGLQPVPLPCIAVIPAPHEILELVRDLAAKADWLVLTSARTVEILWPHGGMASTSVAAVGPVTASAVEQAGGRVTLVGDAGGGKLAVELAERIDGLSVLFPHASGTNRATIEILQEAAGRFEALPVYGTRPLAPGPDPVDAVTFGSPSAVRGWALTRDFDDLVLATIGDATATALADAARRPEVMPPRPDLEDLFALLAQHMRQRSPV